MKTKKNWTKAKSRHGVLEHHMILTLLGSQEHDAFSPWLFCILMYVFERSECTPILSHVLH